MKPVLIFGLLAGLIGFLLIVPVAALMGLCGPGVTLLAAAAAGFFSTYFGTAPTRWAGAQAGALAGSLTSLLTLVGQLVGGLLALGFIQATGVPTVFGAPPDLAAPVPDQIQYYGGGLVVGLCFGFLGVGLGAMAGGLAGAFGVREPIRPSPLGVAAGGGQPL